MATDEERIAAAAERYTAAAHAMQTGVAYEIQTLGDDGSSPKHLRTGVNSAFATLKGLSELLIAKGVMTRVEYFEAMAKAMEEERDLYQRRMPAGVTLA